MCCYTDKESTERLQKHFKKRKTLVAFKVIRPGNNTALYGFYRYKPGVNIASAPSGKVWTGKYNSQRPLGIHVYLSRPSPYYDNFFHKIIEVTCHRDDFVRAGNEQAVFRKVWIAKKELS